MNLNIKKRTMLVLAAVLAFAAVFTACSSGSGEAIEQVLKINETYTEDGVFFFDTKLLYFTDRASGATVPVCDKPNCEHEPYSQKNPSPACGAAFVGVHSMIATYNDKLYFFGTSGSTSSFNHYALFQSDLNGSNRRTIAEFEDIQWIDRAVFQAPYLMIAYSNQYDMEAGGTAKSEKWTMGIIVINLDTGKVEPFPTRKEYPSPIYDMALIDGKIYYTYTLPDAHYLSSDVPTDPDEYYAFMREHHEDIIQCYDLETKTESQIFSTDAMIYFTGNGKSVNVDWLTNTPTVSLFDFATGETKEILKASGFNYLTFDAENNRILYHLTNEAGRIGTYYYDLSTEEHVAVNDSNYLIFNALINDTVYVTFSGGETGELSLGYISKEDYYSGDFSKKVFLRYLNQ